MAMILEGGFMPDGSLAAPSMAEFSDPAPDFLNMLEPEAPAKDLFQAAKRRQETLFRETDVDALVNEVDWLGVAGGVAARERFTHFDLIFADVLKARGGFDVIVGNPPWAKPSWNEADIIGDIDPGFITRKLSAAEARQARSIALKKEPDRKAFLAAFASVKGAMTVTGAAVMHPFAGGGQNNLYRCFIDLSFRLAAPEGFAALIHQDGHLTDPRAGSFRRAWYGRIVKHFDFLNVVKTKNFAEVAHYARFSLNIYSNKSSNVNFTNITYAFLPSQVEESLRHDGAGVIPTFKTLNGDWDTRGHADRVVTIDGSALAAIHALTEDTAVPVDEARFLQPYSNKMLQVFRVIAAAPSLADVIDPIIEIVSTPDGERQVEIPGWQMSSIWHETGAQKGLGVIHRETRFHDKPDEMVISGPMFHVGNPFYKTPKAVCRTKADFEIVDLNKCPDDYLPRTNYSPSVGMSTYRSQLPRCRWDHGKSHVDFYRLSFRRMINLNSERSLISAIISKGICHIHAVESAAFNSIEYAVASAAQCSSIIIDYLIKASGVTNFNSGVLGKFPWQNPGDTAKHRTLRLACLTHAYAGLWNELAHTLRPLPWHSRDPRLIIEGPMEGPVVWDRNAALRNDFVRRMALIEIDVLVAQSLGLTLDQLIDIYRIYFPVLQQNEAGTWYDKKGRIAWSCSKGLPGVGYLEEGRSPSRRRWEQILESSPRLLDCEAVIDFLPGGPQQVIRTFEGPFDMCDRVEDYKRAWDYFEAHKEKGAAE
ncbi:hypothetical protein [uncultured Rhodoblastus sp.]|uniref:hypothetical protein n=1 Tax=uncultured Rhodoblastus sp. TaxID=543037 RepID=UPI0025F223F4|nr:hypothetical protein [uncultured Rhodoblastus sp.]